MKFKNFLSILFVGALFVACSNNLDEVKVPEGIETHIEFAINVGTGAYLANSPRALPNDYHYVGEYGGSFLIQHMDIYMQNSAGAVEAKRFSYDKKDLAISEDGSVLTLSQPLRTTSGTKSIFIIVNNPSPLSSTYPSGDDLVDIAGLANWVPSDVDGVSRDGMTKTGEVKNVNIAPNITPQQAAAGPTNKFTIPVVRMGSRVIVTTTASTDVKDTGGTKIGTLSNITYSVAQGTKKVYRLGKPDYTTYGSAYVPALGDYSTQAPTYYDYSDLSTPEPIPANPLDLGVWLSMKGKYLFENTHTAGDVKTSQYKKGNTAYVLVKAKFTPEQSAIKDGGTLPANGTFFVGAIDRLIYSSKAAAQDRIIGVQGQRVYQYDNGKVLYYAWVNPDNVNTPLNSPVLRNHMYLVNVTGFSKIGFNWNPLDPGTDNPDPKPDNPDEPDSSIDPVDPLTPEETYMSVNVTVVLWKIHYYDVEF